MSDDEVLRMRGFDFGMRGHEVIATWTDEGANLEVAAAEMEDKLRAVTDALAAEYTQQAAADRVAASVLRMRAEAEKTRDAWRREHGLGPSMSIEDTIAYLDQKRHPDEARDLLRDGKSVLVVMPRREQATSAFHEMVTRVHTLGADERPVTIKRNDLLIGQGVASLIFSSQVDAENRTRYRGRNFHRVFIALDQDDDDWARASRLVDHYAPMVHPSVKVGLGVQFSHSDEWYDVPW